MRVIGLDFGTTNSILSFYNEQLKTIEAYKMGGADGNNYIPSFLSFLDNEIFIGDEAKKSVTDPHTISYSNFKMLLSETDKEKLISYNYIEKTPKEIAKLYIKTLLETYKNEQNIKEIDSFVLTVPEIWIKENMYARTAIKDIIDELKLPLKQLISEPVAAGAYFLNNYKTKEAKDYNGHLLVFDYGGGTLDITLLEADKGEIKTLERTGTGKNKDSIGKAGVAYDELVVMSLYEQTFDEKLEKNSAIYHELLLEFERNKIINKNLVKSRITQYQKSATLDREIFSLRCDKGKISIKPSSLIDVFNKLLKSDITSSLIEIRESFKIYGIDINNHDEFKIVMVGGFSNYYLSQSAVKDFFNSVTDSDRRFETYFTLEDTTLAISKGATLIANGFVKLDETYPITMGLVLFMIDGSGELKEIREMVFKKGSKVTAHRVNYNSNKVVQTGNIILFLDNGRTSYKIKLDKYPEHIFPNIDLKDNTWNIGFSIDENSFFYLYIKDKNGVEKKTELGNIIEESLLQISKSAL